jgi:hypothetical protein
MSTAFIWLGALLATDVPALPAAWAMQLGLTVGWALVLALLGVALGWRCSLPVRRGLAAAIALWTLVPGPVSPDYWLGLAFHAPSLSAMLVCGYLLWRVLFPSGRATPVRARAWTRSAWLLLMGALALGDVLLLDTFAMLPLQLYAWGFSPALLLGLAAVALLPWLLRSETAGATGLEVWVAPLALLLFVLTRLPTGNVWDALLDPWLWLVLHGLLIRRLLRWWRG